MKRSILTVAAISGVLALTASASAGTKDIKRDNKNSDKKNSMPFSVNGHNQVSKYTQGNYGLIGDAIAHFKHKNEHKNDPQTPTNNPIPLDPGRGDGRVPTATVNPQPVGKPGFVWVGDHWEREKAPSKTPPPLANGGTVVSTSTWGLNGATVNDHRHPSAAGANGGVVVTARPNSGRIPTLSGPGPLETLGNGLSAVGSGIKDLVSTEVGSPAPTPNDHRRPPRTSK